MKTTTTATMPLPDVASDRMKALVYRGPGKRAWENRPKPTITQATDAVVKITTSTICGTDLHILKGDVPSVAEGRILGHEGVGVVETVGSAVTSFVAGDRVLISCITACGKCEYAERGCTRIVGPVDGFSATRSTGRRPNTCEFLTPTQACITCPLTPTKKRSSCSATSCPPVSSAAY